MTPGEEADLRAIDAEMCAEYPDLSICRLYRLLDDAREENGYLTERLRQCEEAPYA